MRNPVALLGRRIRNLAPRFWCERTALRRLANSGRTLVVFEADWFGLYPFVRPLVLRLNARPSTAIVVATRASEIAPIREWFQRETRGAGCAAAIVSFETIASIKPQPALLISCQPFSVLAANFPDIPKIQLLHGMADKRGELFGPQKLTDFTHLFSPAPVVTELARERLLGRDQAGHPPIEIVEIGCPKTDDLFDGTFARDEVVRSLGLPADRPTVLYAPTWEKEASLEQHGEQIVSALSELEINLLVKPHPLTVADRTDPFLIENGHGGKDWTHILKGWERHRSNLRWVRDSYANPYLVAADLLVSEGSGVAFEFVLLNKPIVFIDTPLVYERHGIDNLHHRLRTCGSIVSRIEDLTSVVEQNLRCPAKSEEPNQRFINSLSYNRSRAATAAIKEISRLLRLGEDA